MLRIKKGLFGVGYVGTSSDANCFSNCYVDPWCLGTSAVQWGVKGTRESRTASQPGRPNTDFRGYTIMGNLWKQ